MATTTAHNLMALLYRKLKYTFVADVLNMLLTRTSFLDGSGSPPSFINFAGGGDFIDVGNHLVKLMIERGGLKNGDTVLDIGYGIGRNAVAASKQLSRIEYHGFDVVRFGINWCRKYFRDQPDSHFIHSDVFNSFYNPRGSTKAACYRFEYPDRKFDFAFATSVFTHTPFGDMQNYLTETARCLKQAGVAYFTCFILDPESRRQIERNAAVFSFRNAIDRAYTERASEPDMAVAYDYAVFHEAAQSCNFEVVRFYPGSWRGLECEDFQDCFVLRKAV